MLTHSCHVALVASAIAVTLVGSAALAGTTVWISGPGDRHQTIIIHDIKKPVKAYLFLDETDDVLASLETDGVDPFDHTHITNFAFTQAADSLLIDPISHLDVMFVSSTGLVADDGTGTLFGVDPLEMTTFEFVFPQDPELSGSIMFAPIPSPGALAVMTLGGLFAARRRRTC